VAGSGLNVRVTFIGLDEVIRAAERLGPAARRETDDAATHAADHLGELVAAAGRSDSRQSARAAATVRVEGSGMDSRVVAGPHPLLFGSEFGALGRFGWYARHRYINSRPRQFRPHRGSASYWFFRTIEANQPVVEREWARALDAIVRDWSA
jgi:hypothetical protein